MSYRLEVPAAPPGPAGLWFGVEDDEVSQRAQAHLGERRRDRHAGHTRADDHEVDIGFHGEHVRLPVEALGAPVRSLGRSTSFRPVGVSLETRGDVAGSAHRRLARPPW